jgi:proteasome lid subunit RPN8/RPN11
MSAKRGMLSLLCCSALLISSQGAQADPLVDLVRAAVPFGRLDSHASIAAAVARRMTDLQRYTVDASKWLSAREQAVAFRLDGSVLWMIEGTRRGVAIPADKDIDLHRAGSRVIFVHTHPSSGSFSSRDLAQLAKPGVAAIVVLGHDGSVYIAGRGPRFDEVRVERTLYAAAQEGIAMRLRLEQPARVTSQTVDHHVGHLAAAALGNTGVIEYSALLSQRRESIYRACGRLCGRLTEAAALRITEIFDTPKSPRGLKEHQ